MSEEQKVDIKEIRRIIRVLERLSGLAKEATRHGSLRDGQAYAIQQYNAILGALAALGIEPPSYFPALAEDAGMGAVGFASAQLAEYLSEYAEGETSGSEEPAGAGSGGTFFNHVFSSGDFQHIGQAFKEAIPEWMRETRRWRESGRSGEAAAAAAAASAASAAASAGRRAAEREARLAEVSARMEAVVAEMRQPGASPEDLRRLAAELARLGEEQARIGREAAGAGEERGTRNEERGTGGEGGGTSTAL